MIYQQPTIYKLGGGGGGGGGGGEWLDVSTDTSIVVWSNYTFDTKKVLINEGLKMLYYDIKVKTNPRNNLLSIFVLQQHKFKTFFHNVALSFGKSNPNNPAIINSGDPDTSSSSAAYFSNDPSTSQYQQAYKDDTLYIRCNWSTPLNALIYMGSGFVPIE